MSKVLAPKGRGGRLCAIYELPGRQRCFAPAGVSSSVRVSTIEQGRHPMQDYNLWADLLATFRASPDFIKALWLLVPPGFVLGMMALAVWMVRLRWRAKPAPQAPSQGRALLLDQQHFEALTIAGDAHRQSLSLPSHRTITLGDPS